MAWPVQEVVAKNNDTYRLVAQLEARVRDMDEVVGASPTEPKGLDLGITSSSAKRPGVRNPLRPFPMNAWMGVHHIEDRGCGFESRLPDYDRE